MVNHYLFKVIYSSNTKGKWINKNTQVVFFFLVSGAFYSTLCIHFSYFWWCGFSFLFNISLPSERPSHYRFSFHCVCSVLVLASLICLLYFWFGSLDILLGAEFNHSLPCFFLCVYFCFVCLLALFIPSSLHQFIFANTG